MGQKEPFSDNRISHGICPECLAYFSEQLQGISLDEYLDRFPIAVLILDAENRILAANAMANVRLGCEPPGQRIGLLSEEVMECRFARLPQGCGRTIHRFICTIRNLVMQTLESKQGYHCKGITVKTDSGLRQLTILTSYVEEMVRLIIIEEQ